MILVFSHHLICQNSWQLKPQAESKVHVNFDGVPFNFSDSLNSFSYQSEPYFVTNKVNYGILVCRVFAKIAFETGLIYDHVSFKYRLEFNSLTHSYTHSSMKTIRYYRIPLKVSFLVAGRDSTKFGKKLYSKAYIFIGKDIRLTRLGGLFVNFKKGLTPQDKKSVIEKTQYGNNELIVQEEMHVSIPRFITNQIGVQYALYNQERENIVSIGIFYSFSLKRNYSYNSIYFTADNKTYSFQNNISGNAFYLTLTKEINFKVHNPNHIKKNKK